MFKCLRWHFLVYCSLQEVSPTQKETEGVLCGLGGQLNTMRGEWQIGNCQLKQLINKAQDENHESKPLTAKSKNIPKT